MITSFEFYQIYTAVSLHFKENSNYDYFRYSGSTSVTEDSFKKAKGKFFYQCAAQKFHNEESALAYIASNFANGCKWVGSLKEEPYIEFLNYRDALDYRFEQDLLKYKETSLFREIISGSKDSWNYIILLNAASKGAVFKEYQKAHGDNILWNNVYNKLTTYAPFLLHCFDIDVEKKKHLNMIIRRIQDKSV